MSVGHVSVVTGRLIVDDKHRTVTRCGSLSVKHYLY